MKKSKFSKAVSGILNGAVGMCEKAVKSPRFGMVLAMLCMVSVTFAQNSAGDYSAGTTALGTVTTEIAKCVKEMNKELISLYKDKGITKIVGIESRGFVMSSALAIELGAGIVLCRKPGKLPCETVQQSYAKEYGIDTIEIHKDAINENDVVLLHDDLLATGGTMKAACDLVRKFNPKKIYANFLIELVNEGLNGRDVFDNDIEVTSLLKI